MSTQLDDARLREMLRMAQENMGCSAYWNDLVVALQELIERRAQS